ncbi:MAG: hypothetical protein JXM75_09445 [Chromatiaceae bacterium]|nr:hypothetical protein [Chromatiaceae bacterium]
MSVSSSRLWYSLILLASLSGPALAESELVAQPIAKTGPSCPRGYTPSGAYCMPRTGARFALEKQGEGICPRGYTPSGGYCVARPEARAALPKVGATCPRGYSPSGAYCVKRP